MLRLPPNRADAGVGCCAIGERFRRDRERKRAAVSPNSAVDVIVVSSNRTCDEKI